MSRILRLFACLVALFFTGNAMALTAIPVQQGYTCTNKTYVSCAEGYYMTRSSSSVACSTGQSTGNACRPCSVYDDYRNVDTGTYYCAGGKSCPEISKVTCDPGKYLPANATSCSNCGGNAYYCPGGTFSVSGTDQGRNSVSSGYYSTGGTSTTRTGQAECEAGYKCSGGVRSSCSGSLEYQNLTGQTSCKSVGVGYYKKSNSAQELCPVNYRDIAATSQANCEGTFEKTGSQITPDMQTGCADRTLGTCSPGTCEYTKKYSGTIVDDCTPTNCTKSQTCTSAEENYYLTGGNAKSCSSFSSSYPYSDGGNITSAYCYRIDTKTGSQENGPVPGGCRSVSSWYDCEPGTCQYKNYYSATDETCTPANCEKDPETVVADDDHYVRGTSCPSCPTSYPYSYGGAGGQTICYKYCSKDCTRQTCPSSAYSCTHGSSSTSGTQYYLGSCNAPSSTCDLTVNSCKSGYYKSGNSCPSCSDLGDGSYTMSANGNSSGSGACYKSCTRACTRPTCPDNAICSYGSSSTSGTQYYNGSCNAASSTCSMTVTCDPGYYKNSSGTCDRCGGNEYYCPGDNTRYSVDSGYYSTGGTSTTRTGQEECTGAKYCTGGVQKSCPLATYGWTRNGGTGWTSYTQCNQTREATSASTYCSAGILKQNAISATAWGATTVSEALSAKAGAYVNGTTCSQCTANDYCPGGTAAPKDCPSGYPNSAAGSDAITDCYSNTKSRPWSGSQVNGTTPTNCYSATWGSCRAEDMAACSYVAYSNSAGTADGTVKSGCTSNSKNCTRQVASVTAKSGYYDAGTTCSECPNGYPNSANGNEGGNTKCYASVSGGHYIGTQYSATQSECVGGTYKAAHTVYYGSTSSCAVCGTNQYSDDGAASCTACKTSAGYGNSGTTAASHDGVASCKVTCDAGEYVPTAGGGCVAVGSGYYKTGTMTVAQNATNTTRSACSSLPGVSVSGGTYSSVSPYNASTTCRYKAPNKTITGCATVTTATVAYSGSAWPATTYTVSASSGYYISDSGTAGATCVGCEPGYACTGGTAARDACDGQTQYQDAAKQSSCKTVSSGWYKVDNTKQAQCTGATYCSGGVKNNCPGSYTADTTAEKTSASQCKISVAKGHHIATANSSTPADCDPGDYRAAHTVNYGSTSSCSACPSGYTSAAGTAGANTECYISVSGGHYIEDVGDNSTNWGTCAAGTYKAAHTVYYGSTSSCSACSGRTKYSGKGASSCSTVSSGYYTTGCNTSGNNCTGQSQCTGATYCVSGVQKSCPAATSGWTRNGGTGWTSYTQCNQTRAATSASSYCSAGTLKQNATSATAWGSTTASALSAKAGAYVNGTTCSQCTANDYCPGGTAARKDCPSGYPNSAAGSDAITDCYSNTKSRPWSGGQNACTKPSGCSTVTCNSCSKSACNYVAYANTAGTGDGTVKSGCSTNNESCDQTVKSVTANPGYRVNGTACAICTGATYSAGGAATSCSNCPTIYTDNTTSGKKAATECQVKTTGGYYIAANNDDAQTICGVRNYCPSATVNYGSHNSPIACPTASEHLRTTYPDNYYNPTNATATNQTWGDGKDAITDCKAVYTITNARGRFTVESTGYNAETEKYDVGGTKYYTKVNPGYYVKDRLASTYCNDTSHPMYYTDAQPCPAGSYCPGLSSMPSCSSGEYTETNGINSCPANYGNSPAMSDAATDCYLTTTAKNFVATPNAAQTTCTAGGYCVGGVKVNYGSTGGRTPAAKGYYVSTTGATTQTPCAAGTYTSSTGQTKCTDAAAGTYTTGCQITSNNTACTGTAVCAINKYSNARASVCIACNTADGYGNSGTTAASHAGQASCKVTCGGGEYVPTAGGGCVNVGVGYWGAGGTVSETSTLARSQCESGLTTIGSGAGADEVGDCGRVLNVNGEKIYLRSTKKTTPSLNVSINGDVFYGNMGASSIGALKLKSNGTTYSVYDDSMQ